MNDYLGNVLKTAKVGMQTHLNSVSLEDLRRIMTKVLGFKEEKEEEEAETRRKRPTLSSMV